MAEKRPGYKLSFQVSQYQEEPDWANGTQQKPRPCFTWRWRQHKNNLARERHWTQHVGIAIETIGAVMAFDLANDVLTSVEDLHVAIPWPPNESLWRGRDATPTKDGKDLSLGRNKGFSSSWILNTFNPSNLLRCRRRTKRNGSSGPLAQPSPRILPFKQTPSSKEILVCLMRKTNVCRNSFLV